MGEKIQYMSLPKDWYVAMDLYGHFLFCDLMTESNVQINQNQIKETYAEQKFYLLKSCINCL